MASEEVRVGKSLNELDGLVRNRYNLRAIEGNASEFNDEGPRRTLHSKVFNILLMLSNQTTNSTKGIDVFFYDKWAEKCQFLQPGDLLKISGPPEMICESIGSDSEHPCSIVFYDDLVDAQVLKIY
jgi:hypothetical protein